MVRKIKVRSLDSIPALSVSLKNATVIGGIADYVNTQIENSENEELQTPNKFTKNQSVAPVVLQAGATVEINASLSNNFKLALISNSILQKPSGMTDGMVLNFVFTQDAVGGRILTFATNYKFGGGSAINTAPDSVSFMSGYYDVQHDILICSVMKGF